MNILIVGAGAVGTVYGRHLQMGGTKVSFFVRPKYVPSCKRGFTFYVMNRPRKYRYQATEMHGFDVFSQLDEISTKTWNYVVLAISSTALRGKWFEEFIRAIGNANIVTLQPGIDDREYILEHFPKERLIEGTIPIVSYLAPLPGEFVPKPGIAYWLPPGSVAYFSGPFQETKTFVEVLRKSPFPAKMVSDARQKIAVPSLILTYLIAALEIAQWKFDKLQRGKELIIACQGMKEGIKIIARHRNLRKPFSIGLKPITFQTVLFLSRWLVPFDFETYLRIHFTKVQEQMHQALIDLLNLSKYYSIAAPATLRLQQELKSKLNQK